jgi:hypothetical protein
MKQCLGQEKGVIVLKINDVLIYVETFNFIKKTSKLFLLFLHFKWSYKPEKLIIFHILSPGYCDWFFFVVGFLDFF